MNEILREYFYDLRCYYPPDDFSREMLIKILLNNKLPNIVISFN
ncbi:hypothetical protein [Terrisporobacter petrolearius]